MRKIKVYIDGSCKNNKNKEKAIGGWGYIFVDEEDNINNLSKILNKLNKKYVHIFIDNGENLTTLEMEFLLSMHIRKTYGRRNTAQKQFSRISAKWK